jgi:hypothetical protein
LTVRIEVVRPHETTLRPRRAHRIPHPTLVTIAKRPSSIEAGWRQEIMISEK